MSFDKILQFFQGTAEYSISELKSIIEKDFQDLKVVEFKEIKISDNTCNYLKYDSYHIAVVISSKGIKVFKLPNDYLDCENYLNNIEKPIIIFFVKTDKDKITETYETLKARERYIKIKDLLKDYGKDILLWLTILSLIYLSFILNLRISIEYINILVFLYIIYIFAGFILILSFIILIILLYLYTLISFISYFVNFAWIKHCTSIVKIIFAIYLSGIFILIFKGLKNFNLIRNIIFPIIGIVLFIITLPIVIKESLSLKIGILFKEITIFTFSAVLIVFFLLKEKTLPVTWAEKLNNSLVKLVFIIAGVVSGILSIPYLYIEHFTTIFYNNKTEQILVCPSPSSVIMSCTSYNVTEFCNFFLKKEIILIGTPVNIFLDDLKTKYSGPKSIEQLKSICNKYMNNTIP